MQVRRSLTRSACPAGRACRGVLRSEPASQASLSAGLPSPTRDRLVWIARVPPLSDSRTVQRSDGHISSSRPVGQTGIWSKLAWAQGPWRSTPLSALCRQGRQSLGLTAYHARDGLPISICVNRRESAACFCRLTVSGLDLHRRTNDHAPTLGDSLDNDRPWRV